MGSFIIELLIHLEDKNHQSLTIDYPGDGEHCKPSGTSWGYPIFIKQSLLDFNSSEKIQYLKDDKLYIRVTPKTMVSSRKPWLDYTHK